MGAGWVCIRDVETGNKLLTVLSTNLDLAQDLRDDQPNAISGTSSSISTLHQNRKGLQDLKWPQRTEKTGPITTRWSTGVPLGPVLGVLRDQMCTTFGPQVRISDATWLLMKRSTTTDWIAQLTTLLNQFRSHLIELPAQVGVCT